LSLPGAQRDWAPRVVSVVLVALTRCALVLPGQAALDVGSGERAWLMRIIQTGIRLLDWCGLALRLHRCIGHRIRLLIRQSIGLPGWITLATLAFGVAMLRLRATPIACTRTSAVFLDHDDSFQECRQIVL